MPTALLVGDMVLPLRDRSRDGSRGAGRNGSAASKSWLVEMERSVGGDLAAQSLEHWEPAWAIFDERDRLRCCNATYASSPAVHRETNSLVEYTPKRSVMSSSTMQA